MRIDMSNLLAEQRLTLAALAAREEVNASTVWRWSLRGVRGVTLETFSIGAKRFTTAEAFARFVATTTEVAQGGPPSNLAPRSSRQRDAAIAAAELELAKAGIK
jgi:hypothetical protein